MQFSLKLFIFQSWFNDLKNNFFKSSQSWFEEQIYKIQFFFEEHVEIEGEGRTTLEYHKSWPWVTCTERKRPIKLKNKRVKYVFSPIKLRTFKFSTYLILIEFLVLTKENYF